MKAKFFGLATLFLMATVVVFAGEKTEKFKVYGNCGMCESRIEKAAKSVDGVQAADWSKESKMVEVKFDNAKTNVHKIHMAIAKAGHDTKLYKAKNETYEKLPACCQYDREELKDSGKKKHNPEEHQH